MMDRATHLATSGDLPIGVSVCACVLAVASFAMLLVEFLHGAANP